MSLRHSQSYCTSPQPTILSTLDLHRCTKLLLRWFLDEIRVHVTTYLHYWLEYHFYVLKRVTRRMTMHGSIVAKFWFQIVWFLIFHWKFLENLDENPFQVWTEELFWILFLTISFLTTDFWKPGSVRSQCRVRYPPGGIFPQQFTRSSRRPFVHSGIAHSPKNSGETNQHQPADGKQRTINHFANIIQRCCRRRSSAARKSRNSPWFVSIPITRRT